MKLRKIMYAASIVKNEKIKRERNKDHCIMFYWFITQSSNPRLGLLSSFAFNS